MGGRQRKNVITFEPLDGFSNFKKVKSLEFCKEFKNIGVASATLRHTCFPPLIGMRFIHYQMALVDGKFSLIYIGTKDNVWADGLSRGKESTENELIKKALHEFLSLERLNKLIDIDF